MRAYSKSPLSYSSSRLSIRSIKRLNTLEIFLFIPVPYLNTIFYPETLAILKKDLPCILKSKCLNELNLPFQIEACQTEIGHLFEHICLENLQKFNYLVSGQKRLFRGITIWDWKKNPKGSFKIEIITEKIDPSVHVLAIAESIKLLEKIILSEVKKEGQHVVLPLEYIS